MRKIKISDLVILSLFLIGFVYVLMYAIF